MSRPHALLVPVAAIAVAVALTGCTANPNAASSATPKGGITVTASDTSCDLSAQRISSGTTSFTVTNAGTQVTEFELLSKNGATIVGEVENVGPGLTQSLQLQAQPGTYTTVCKPNMVGSGVGKGTFTVTGTAVALAGDDSSLAKQAAARYVGFVRDQTRTLLVRTKAFAALYVAGHTAKAKALYPTARGYYERIEPVAESFGALDPELDARESDLSAGQTWTGWHRIEKDLWRPSAAANGGKAYTALTAAQRKQQAATLVTDTERLEAKVTAPDFTVAPDAIGNGSIGLMDEVAKTKITGEEEIWSHTDLYDFQANVTGAEVAYDGVRAIAKAHQPSLVTELDARFRALDALLAHYGSPAKGFVSYRSLSQADVKALSDSVNALSEPLSQLTSAVLK